VTRDDWMRRLGPLYSGAVALVRSTPLRWPASIAAPPDEPRASIWIVAVGALTGLAAYLVAVAADAVLPGPLSALLGLATLTFASAAITERGVVQRIDGNAVAAPSVLAILVLVFGSLVRGAAIVLVPADRWLGAFTAAALVGRWAAVFLQSLGDPIVDEEPARSLVVARAPAWLVAAVSAGVLVIAALALGKAGVVAMAVAALLAFAFGVDTQRRDGTLSAPAVATAAAIGELVVLLAATA